MSVKTSTEQKIILLYLEHIETHVYALGFWLGFFYSVVSWFTLYILLFILFHLSLMLICLLIFLFVFVWAFISPTEHPLSDTFAFYWIMFVRKDSSSTVSMLNDKVLCNELEKHWTYIACLSEESLLSLKRTWQHGCFIASEKIKKKTLEQCPLHRQEQSGDV